MARGLLGFLAICTAFIASEGLGAGALRWGLSEEPPTMKLAYGEPDTDNVGLILRCHPGTGIVYLSWQLGEKAAAGRALGAKWPGQLQLVSGRARQRLPVEVELTETGPIASADPSAYGPVMKAFAYTGRISVDGEAQDARSTAERRAVASFMEQCYEVAD